MRFTLLAITLLFVLIGCNSTGRQHVVKPATPEQRAALLDRIKSLEGTWEGVAPDGTKGVAVYQVTSNGNAVREIMFPGSPHEMTNMYTMDGDELLMTHYCAMGNQPHMRATASGGNRIVFKSAGVSNLTAPDQIYMGEMTIEFVNDDHIRQHWQSLKRGQPAEHSMTIEKTRRK